MSGTLRVGVACAGPTVPGWQVDVIEALAEVEKVETVVLLIDGAQPSDDGSTWSFYERRILGKDPCFRKVDLAAALPDTPVLEGWRPGESQERVDVLLSLVPDRVFDPARWNLDAVVWRYRFGRDDGEELPTPSTIEEIASRPPAVTAALRWFEPGAGWTVRKEGAFRTAGLTLRGVLASMYTGCSDWAASVCRTLIDEPAPVGWPEDGPVMNGAGKRPAAVPVLGRAARSYLSWQVTERFFFADGWNIGVADAPIHDFLGSGPPPPIRWLPEPDGARFMADPFGISDGDGLHILAEEWDLRTGASIRSVRVDAEGRIEDPRHVTGLPEVASYPYLFQHDGEIYCVPETAPERRVVLYRATEFPERWTAVATLIEGLALADPTVFRAGDLWWLLCTDVERGRLGRLLGFYADDLAGPWRPHLGNPLKTDVRSSRPAGTPFEHGGSLYRPTQDCSFTYGGAVAINRVLRLDPKGFEEVVEKVVAPDRNGAYPKGIHTLSAVGDVTLVDGKRRRFLWQAFKGEVSSVFRRRLGSDRARADA